MAMAAAAQSSSSSFSFITASPSRQTTSSSSNTTLAPICSRLGKVSQLSISKFGQCSYTSVRALQVKAACWISQNQRKKHKQRATLLQVIKAKTAIQFIEGRDEQTVPEVKLTKSKDGNNGVATFTFAEPSVFDETSKQVGDITGLYLIDDEGVIRSVDVTAKFVNGRPSRIEARHVMRSPAEWDRFMRFMERYATDNGLQFIKK